MPEKSFLKAILPIVRSLSQQSLDPKIKAGAKMEAHRIRCRIANIKAQAKIDKLPKGPSFTRNKRRILDKYTVPARLVTCY
jgi:dTDP-4-amino-4,6-dideoxygalactose transaminase